MNCGAIAKISVWTVVVHIDNRSLLALSFRRFIFVYLFEWMDIVLWALLSKLFNAVMPFVAACSLWCEVEQSILPL